MTQETVAGLRQEALARIETDPRGAVASYQKLLKLDPSDIDGWSKTGSLLHRLGQHEAAADAFEQVRRLADHANSPEWKQYAQQSIAFIRSSAPPRPEPHPRGGTPGGHAPYGAHPAQGGAAGGQGQPAERRGPSFPDGQSVALPGAGESVAESAGTPARGAMPPALGTALLTFSAGVGFLTLVVSGAVSQLWHYPFVRAGLLRTTDDLMVSALCCYLGATLLQKGASRHTAVRTAMIALAACLLLLSFWLLLSGLGTLSGVFGECTNIETMPAACNIQLEEYQKLTPAKRLELNVL